MGAPKSADVASDVPRADVEAATLFLTTEHAGRDVHLNAVPRTGRREDKLRGITFAADDRAGISAWIAQQAEQGYCAYWMPNSPTDGQRQSVKRPRFTEEEITAVRWAYLDVDPVGDEAPEQVVARVVARLRSFSLPPTWFICSGRGVQLLWRLKASDDAHGIGLGTDLRVSDPERRQDAREINYGLMVAFGGEAEGADGCYSLEHLYRIPGSLHVKIPSKPLRCFIVHEHSNPESSYEPGQFMRMPLPATQQGKRVEADSIHGDPEPVSVARLQEWAKSAGRQIPDKPLAYIATGDASDFGNDRSDMVFYVAAALDRAGVPPLLIACALFDRANPISAHIHEKGGRDPWSYARRQVVSARDDNLRKATTGESADTVLNEMNRLHAVVTSGRVRVVSFRRTNPTIDRLAPDLQSFEDFRNRYRHQQIAVGSDKQGDKVYKRKGDWWLDHPGRREILGLCFAPGEAPNVGGFQNLWLGFGIEPAAGDWSRMREHVNEVLANGNPAHADYIIRWAAWAVQNPEKQAEAALVFRGRQGTGKGFFGRTLKELFGQHGLHIKSAKHLTGDFNLHLRDCCLLFADEAIAPGDKGAESRLKGLITEPDLTIEGKGENLVTEPNHLHVVMASNEDWVVPAAADERRYAVFNVASDRQGDRAYFEALNRQLNEGGRAAMLHDLLALPLDGWHPRWNIPQTDALAMQKAEGLVGFEAFVLDMLDTDGWASDRCVRGYRFLASSRLLEDAQKWLHRRAGVNHVTYNKIEQAMVGVLGCTKHRISGAENGYLLPDTDEMRSRWDEKRFPWAWKRFTPTPPSRAEKPPF